jgi:hypothetical protein
MGLPPPVSVLLLSRPPLTTSRDATAPTDLAATLATLQARVTAAEAEAEAQRVRAAVAALELQLATILGVAAPPPHPAIAAASAPAAAPGQAPPPPVAGAFGTSSVGYLHAHAVGI